MQEVFDKGTQQLNEVVYSCVASSVRGSGEKVLAECRGDERARPESNDRHGLSRHEVFSAWFLVIVVPFLGVLSGLSAITAGSVLETAMLAVGACVCIFGSGWAALWAYRANRDARRDSTMRRYILTDQRLVVVGADSFVEVPLHSIATVGLKEHHDGTGTVVCTYRDSINTKTIAIEGIEGAAGVRQSLEDARTVLRGRALREQVVHFQGEEAVRR